MQVGEKRPSCGTYSLTISCVKKMTQKPFATLPTQSGSHATSKSVVSPPLSVKSSFQRWQLHKKHVL